MATMAEIKKNFTHHEPDEDKFQVFQAIREQGRALAELILKEAPQGREQSLALTKVEEAVMWANAAIARNV